MSEGAVEIAPCPPGRRVEAIALVLTDIAPSQRGEIASVLMRETADWPEDAHGLFIAQRNSELRGAVWAQRQPGNTAVLWPPRLERDEPLSTAEELAGRAVDSLDVAHVAMTQTLLPTRDSPDAPLLGPLGFQHLTDLLYLTCERQNFPTKPPVIEPMRFLPFDESKCGRLSDLLEKTYDGSLDCVGLGSHRRMSDVIDGYLATGTYPPKHWFIVQADAGSETQADVGVLLLAEHPQPRHLEMIYMGLIPAVRGRGWGRQIAQFAQWVASEAAAERIVLAVDAANWPGLSVYRDASFYSWDKRAVFVRFCR
jgi:ribosomal protein S18 acetylase RimI-like enzyme